MSEKGTEAMGSPEGYRIKDESQETCLRFIGLGLTQQVQLNVPKSWMKTGKTVNLGSLGDGAVLMLWIGNDSASTEDFYWGPEDMKISLENISFRIQYYYDGELCTLEGFGVAMY